MKKTICRGRRPRRPARKAISLILSLIMLLSITAGLDFSAFASVVSGSCSENTTYTFDTSTGTLTISGTGAMADYYNLPNTSDFYFDYNVEKTKIKKVIIEEGITTISNSSFSDCTSMKSIRIPTSVTSINNDAFKGCTALNRVDISSINAWYKMWIGNLYANPLCYAHKLYLNGTLVENLTIPTEIDTLDYFAFAGCESLKAVKIQNTVKSIEPLAFYDCGISSITIPGSVTAIKTGTFAYCFNLTNITIPKSVTTIEESAFYYCNKLKDVYYSGTKEDWTKVSISGNYNIKLFNSCIHCSNGVINNAIKNRSGKDDENGFSFTYKNGKATVTGYYGNSTVVKIPAALGGCTVTTIGEKAFKNEDITSVTIPDSVTIIEDDAFLGCYSLQKLSLSKKLVTIGDGAFESCFELNGPLILPSGLKRIGQCAFSNCTNLATVVIPKSVKYINISAFYFSYLSNVYYGGTKSNAKRINLKYKEPSTNKMTYTFNDLFNGWDWNNCRIYYGYENSPKNLSVYSGKKAITAYWTKKASISGYQIQYSTNKNFKKGKNTKTIKVKSKKSSVLVKKLNSKKIYYVRIRAYKTIDGKKVYSKWSVKKKIKVK